MIQIKSAKGPVAGPPNIGGTREVSRHRSSVLRVFLKSLVLALSSVACVWSQNMINYGAVTSGAAVGGAAGRALSDNLNSIFGSVEGAKKKAAKPKTAAPKTYIPRPPTPDFSAVEEGSLPTATVIRPGRQRAVASRTARRTAASADTLPNLPMRTAGQTSNSLKFWVPTGFVLEAPTPARIAQIPLGEDVDNLGMQLGTPANQVVFPGSDGRLWQRVKYKNEGRDVGVIYVADGKVVEVVPAVP